MNACDFFPGWLTFWDVICNETVWQDEIIGSVIPYQLLSKILYWFSIEYELDRYGCLDSELL